jgi:hypothetical protein
VGKALRALERPALPAYGRRYRLLLRRWGLTAAAGRHNRPRREPPRDEDDDEGGGGEAVPTKGTALVPTESAAAGGANCVDVVVVGGVARKEREPLSLPLFFSLPAPRNQISPEIVSLSSSLDCPFHFSYKGKNAFFILLPFTLI